MSRKFTRSMALILSFCAAQNSWSNSCFEIPSSAKLNEIKTELEECREDYRALAQKVNELKDSTKKDYAELEKKFTESNEQITKMHTTMLNMLNSSDQICKPQQVKLDERAALTSSEPDLAEKIIEIIEARNAKIQEAKNAGIEVVVLDGKVVCADSQLEYDVYKTLSEEQKKAVKTAVKCGYKIEYVNSVLLLNGEKVDEYMKAFDEFVQKKIKSSGLKDYDVDKIVKAGGEFVRSGNKLKVNFGIRGVNYTLSDALEIAGKKG